MAAGGERERIAGYAASADLGTDHPWRVAGAPRSFDGTVRSTAPRSSGDEDTAASVATPSAAALVAAAASIASADAPVTVAGDPATNYLSHAQCEQQRMNTLLRDFLRS
eukprot:COSAG06_NODE_28541_length_572_cov_1.164905_1_plen_109_part_00